MAAATAVVIDCSETDAQQDRLCRLEATVRELRATNLRLQNDNQRLTRELLLTRMSAGDIATTEAIADNTTTARVWLEWASCHHHTSSCACHRCTTARTVLSR